ncbi:MAG: DUF2079 domain-containing protein [Candidatus Zhuqueibacterota bacterium]
MKRKFNHKSTHRNTVQVKGNQSSYYNYTWIAAGIYTCVMSYLSIIRYESFSASVYDLGIMIQTVWNTSQGWLLQESVNMGYPMMRFWMAHWEFIYVPIALIYRLFSSPYTLLILHAAVVALGAVPIYKLAYDKSGNGSIAFSFSVSYLLYPAIQNATLCDVHGVTFAAPFLLFAFYYLQKNKIGLFALFSAIAISCREDSALLILMMGVYAFLILKKRKLGIIVAIVGFSWFFIWYERMAIRSMLGLPEFIIMEGAEAHWDHLARLKDDPFYLVSFLAKKYNIRYFIYLFGPVLLLSLFSPMTLLMALPMFAINLLSSYYYTHDVEHYYSATIAPFIYISAIYGFEKIQDYLRIRHHKKLPWLRAMPILILLSSLIFFFLKSNAFDAGKWTITDHHRTIKKVIAHIPEQASLSADAKLATHAAERHELYAFNDHAYDADYVLYDFYAPKVALVTRTTFHLPFFWADNDSIRNVLANEAYGIVVYEDGVCLFEKNADYDSGLRRLAYSEGQKEMNSLHVEVAPGLVCRGYQTFEQLRYYVDLGKFGDIAWQRGIHFTCFWEAAQTLEDTLLFQFKIENPGTGEQFSFDHAPVFGVFPTTRWEAGRMIQDEIFTTIPAGTKAGMYQISVRVKSDLAEGQFDNLFDLEIEGTEQR